MRLIADGVATLPELPAVICLQEVETRSLRSRPSHDRSLDGQTQLEAFMLALDGALERQERPERYRGLYFPAHTYRVGPARIYTTGLAVLVRSDLEVDDGPGHEPQDITHRRFRLTARLKQSRVCAHVRIRDKDGQPIDVFNTHLSLPSFLSKRIWWGDGRMGYGDNQLAEVDALCDFVADRADGDRFVVVGDLNSLPASPAYARLLERLPVEDAFARSLGLEAGALRLAWPTCGFLHFRMRLDHLFVGPGLVETNFDGSHRFGDRTGRWHGLSDHVPILAGLEPR